MIVKFKRGMKLWKSLVCVLMMVMLLPIGVPIHKVYAATGSGYVTVSPSVIVGNYKELVKAIDEAEDGDAIGISSNICMLMVKSILKMSFSRIVTINGQVERLLSKVEK